MHELAIAESVPRASLIAEMFPTEVRWSCASMGYQLAASSAAPSPRSSPSTWLRRSQIELYPASADSRTARISSPAPA